MPLASCLRPYLARHRAVVVALLLACIIAASWQQWEQAPESEATLHRSGRMAEGRPVGSDVIETIESFQRERKKLLFSFCQKRSKKSHEPTKESFVNLRSLYSRRYKFSTCYIAKSGYTSWLKAVLVADGYFAPGEVRRKDAPKDLWAEIERKRLRFSSMANAREREARWRESFKIVTVRDPFSRLVSAYNDKMVPSSPGFTFVYGPLSRRICEAFKPMRRSIGGDNITASFEDFVNFLLHHRDVGIHKLDTHWNFYDAQCQPCLVDYDYIVKFETLSQDISYLKRKLNISKEHNSSFFPERSFKTGSDMVERYFRGIPESKTSLLFEMYREDFEMFGYRKPKWLN